LKTQICFKKGKIQIQGKKSSRAGRKKAPHFEVVAQKGRYKESQKGKSCGAKRRIQGCYSSGSKEKWGRFLNKNFHIVLTWVKIFLMNLNEIY